MVLSIILWFTFGVAAGLAGAIYVNKNRQFVPLVLLGIIGALVGGAFGQLLISDPSHFNFGTLIIAVLGAIILIGSYKNISPQR